MILLLAPCVAGLVEPEMDPVEVDIHEVRAAGSVQVRQEQTPGIEIELEARRICHRHALAETAVAQVGPVVDPAVVHQDDVVQAIAGHVGQAHSSCRIVEEHIRELIEVVHARDGLRRGEALFAQAFEPQEMLSSGQQRIRQAVSGQIDQPYVGILPGRNSGSS